MYFTQQATFLSFTLTMYRRGTTYFTQQATFLSFTLTNYYTHSADRWWGGGWGGGNIRAYTIIEGGQHEGVQFVQQAPCHSLALNLY